MKKSKDIPQEIKDPNANKRLVTFKKPEYIRYLEDIAQKNGVSCSAVMENIIMNSIDTNNEYLNIIYNENFKNAVLLYIQNIAANFNNRQKTKTNIFPFVEFLLSIFNRTSSAGTDPIHEDLLQEHFPRNKKLILEAIKHYNDNKKLTFEEQQQLEQTIEYLSVTPADFVAYNYIIIILAYWDILKNNAYTYSLLYDVIALSRADLWERSEDRLKFIEFTSNKSDSARVGNQEGF